MRWRVWSPLKNRAVIFMETRAVPSSTRRLISVLFERLYGLTSHMQRKNAPMDVWRSLYLRRSTVTKKRMRNLHKKGGLYVHPLSACDIVKYIENSSLNCRISFSQPIRHAECFSNFYSAISTYIRPPDISVIEMSIVLLLLNSAIA